MASNPLTLLDLPSKAPCRAWSFNPWRTRFLLNFKGIDYKTEWVEFPHIKERLEKHISANEEGFPYTVPTVIMPDGKYVMTSKRIAVAIEELQPQPSANVDSPYVAKVEELVGSLITPLLGIFVLVPGRVLNDVSAEYWRTTRQSFLGMSLEQFAEAKGGDKVWEGAEPLLKQVTALLEENQDGPFFMGKTVSYADFVWGALLVCLKSVGPEILQKAIETSGNAKVHQDMLDGLAPYAERDSE